MTATERYESLVPGWSSFSPRVKFSVVAELQKARIKKERHSQATQAWIAEFHPPEGYLTSRQVCEFLGVCRQTITRWISKGNVREYREGHRVAFSLEDLRASAEACARSRKGNSWVNRREKHE